MEKLNTAFFKPRMLTVGPTPVPEFVLGAMAASVHYHRSPQFSEIVEDCRKILPKVFGTKEEVLIFSGSGTLAMEGAIANFFEKGETVISINSGKFGQRWTDQARIYGLDVKEIFVERGKAVDISQVESMLDDSVRGVLVHASETSTGVRHDIKSIAAMTKDRDCLTLVDGVTAVGCFGVPMDAWGIDVMVAGSQKGFMLPPGLSFAASSPKAWEKCLKVDSQRYYLDWRKEMKSIKKNTGAFTSAVTLIGGLRAVLNHMENEGLENIYRCSWKLSFAARASLKKLGAKLFVEEDQFASPACTPIYTEDVLKGKEFIDRYGMTLSGGQDELKGKILRLGHLGYVDAWNVYTQIAAVARCFERSGRKMDWQGASEEFFRIADSDHDLTPAEFRMEGKS